MSGSDQSHCLLPVTKNDEGNKFAWRWIIEVGVMIFVGMFDDD